MRQKTKLGKQKRLLNTVETQYLRHVNLNRSETWANHYVVSIKIAEEGLGGAKPQLTHDWHYMICSGACPSSKWFQVHVCRYVHTYIIHSSVHNTQRMRRGGWSEVLTATTNCQLNTTTTTRACVYSTQGHASSDRHSSKGTLLQRTENSGQHTPRTQAHSPFD